MFGGSHQQPNVAKQEGEKGRIRKPQTANWFMKIIWKIHEVARGKGPLSWKLRCPTCQISLKKTMN